MELVRIKQLDFVTIYTKDLTASRKFYVDVLGFPLMREVTNEFFQISMAGVPICVDLSSEGQQNNIGLQVEDLSAAAVALHNKGLTVHSGSNAASKEYWISIKDPDGNEIIFLTHKI